MRAKSLAVFTAVMPLLSSFPEVTPTELTADDVEPTAQDSTPEQETAAADAAYTQTPQELLEHVQDIADKQGESRICGLSDR